MILVSFVCTYFASDPDVDGNARPNERSQPRAHPQPLQPLQTQRLGPVIRPPPPVTRPPPPVTRPPPPVLVRTRPGLGQDEAGTSTFRPASATPRRCLALQEHSRLFRHAHSSLPPPKKRKTSTFGRIVLCLPGCNSEHVPTKEEKAILKNNGLGEVLISFETGGDSAHVQDQILSAFQKDELHHGFEIMTVRTKSRTALQVVHSGPCNAQDLKLISTQKVYIRPIQQDINIESDGPPATDHELPCCKCGALIHTSKLREHSELCNYEETQEDDQRPSLSDCDSVDLQANIEVPSDEDLPSVFEVPPLAISSLTEECKSDEEELARILTILKEGLSEQTDIGQVIHQFRSIYLNGRRLNLPEDIADMDASMQGDTYLLHISRYDIFQGMVDEFSAAAYRPRLPLEIQFMGERGQDLGGLRKEFLRLALQEVHERLTQGPDRDRVLVTEPEQATRFCQQKAFLAAGILMGQCILQDGPSPNFLESGLAVRLVEGTCDAHSEQQLHKGLCLTGVVQLMKTFPQCKELLHGGEDTKLTAAALLSSFEVKFAEPGSNRRRQEEAVFSHFVRYVREVEAGSHHCNSDEELMTLEQIIIFVTGLSHVPVCGWQPPLTITFFKPPVMGIGASTCSHELQLPIPYQATETLPSRDELFQLFDNSFPDQFFGNA
ncbi:uncharacterized protein LOC115929288 [Strongylocentrotus purpuratus]|uniref:HECT domain-containing protein n=1 Tax=Strongylocentrotus purpuratus TaxID=7668 RepID=A0A7M7T4T2_STRPU|nr:uncharacterized protein LOC115929288 [Strongylocentrotus purpuratus]